MQVLYVKFFVMGLRSVELSDQALTGCSAHAWSDGFYYFGCSVDNRDFLHNRTGFKFILLYQTTLVL